jgi:hypothetical protein
MQMKMVILSLNHRLEEIDELILKRVACVLTLNLSSTALDVKDSLAIRPMISLLVGSAIVNALFGCANFFFRKMFFVATG